MTVNSSLLRAADRTRAASLVALSVIGLFSATVAAVAAPAAPAAAQTVSGISASAGTYKIQTEDVLDISVVDHPEVARPTVPVSTDGTIDYPYVGQIKVAGMTLSDLKKRIARDLSKQFVRPQVLITVAQRRVRTFSAVGAVASKGKHPLKDNQRVLEALADCGGLPADRFEFFTARVLRADGAEVPVDLARLFANDPTANFLMQENDTLYVAEKDPVQTQVQVVGQVAKPGPQVWPRDGSIISVLQNAGGPTPLARLSQATIEREGKNIVIDLRSYQKDGFEPTEKLRPGDKLILPENKLEYYVFGPVGRSGTQVYPDDRTLTLRTALSLAGGQLQGVELKKTKLVRAKPDGTSETRTINVEKMWKSGDWSDDVVIQPGDTIIVPPAGGRRGIDPLQVAGGAFGFIQLFNFIGWRP